MIGSVWETGKRPVCPRFSTASLIQAVNLTASASTTIAPGITTPRRDDSSAKTRWVLLEVAPTCMNMRETTRYHLTTHSDTGGRSSPMPTNQPGALGLPASGITATSVALVGPEGNGGHGYMQHDRCYAQSRVKDKKCSASQLTKDTGSCDWQLMKCLGKLPDTDASAYNPGAAIASQLFWMMGIWKLYVDPSLSAPSQTPLNVMPLRISF